MPKRYKVTGTQPVLNDKMPGTTFDDVLDPGVEGFLLGIGAIEIISHDVDADQRIKTQGATKKAAAKKKA